MSEDNILPFPNRMHNAMDDAQWKAIQGEFYLDCFHAQHGYRAEDPEQLRVWLQEAGLFADMENAFFRGWLLRRLAEDTD